MKYFIVLFATLLALAFATSAVAQTDAFGQMDRVYADSTVAVQGQTVAVHFSLKNDEAISSVSVPLTYDTSKVTLKGISFTDSRVDYISTKIISPAAVSEINGQFVVAVIKMLENAIPVGDGLLFTCTFTLKSNVPIGTVVKIDSLFFPPGNELLLTENATSQSIYPAFAPGKIVVRQADRAPQLNTVTAPYVLEGDTLRLTLSATDADNDSLRFALTTKPAGATLTQTGKYSARIEWITSYVGPNSADGSPYNFGIWVSDGTLSTEQELSVPVVNRNRPPAIDAPSRVEVQAGDSMNFSVSATDPDFEQITWRVSGQPNGSRFNGLNPGRFSWQAPLTDSGSSTLTFIATDPQGFADTVQVTLHVAAVTLYTLSIDTASAYPAEEATCSIHLENKLAVASFNLLINYDATAMTLESVTKVGTRAEAFTTYTVTTDVNGQAGTVRIVGAAPSGSPLEAGEGAVAKLTFKTVNDLSFSGQSVPVKFVFLDGSTRNDNTMTTSAGVKIPQSDIYYYDGYVTIKKLGTISIGDINLNGVACEIGDIIYFTNFFVYPAAHPFNALQYANSDINQDGMYATIADLVRLINIVVNGGSSSRVSAIQPAASLRSDADSRGISFSYDANFEVGGVYLTLATQDQFDPAAVSSPVAGMSVMASREGSNTRVLVYGAQGETMPEGNYCFLNIPGLTNFQIVSIELASAAGDYVSASATSTGSLPSSFTLEQNFPNPFNPETTIRFALPQSAPVSLIVYDVLGRRVRTLIDGNMESGSHAVRWDGRDETGTPVASGIYFYRLDNGTQSSSRKMMLLK